MNFLSAIAVYIQGQIDGLYAFKDDLAFYAAGNPYDKKVDKMRQL